MGYPLPTITWRLKGKALSETTAKAKITVRGLEINDVTIEDAGKVECHAKSILGEATATAILNVLGKYYLMHENTKKNKYENMTK